MTLNHSDEFLISLLGELLKLPNETEWVEFKHNNKKPEAVGEYISALANSAAILGKQYGYMIWGVDDASHTIVGTDFSPKQFKYKQQEFESWLLQKLTPKVHFKFHELEYDNCPVVILEILAASHTPVQFDKTEFIRVGSYKKRLDSFPEKERELWRVFDQVPFERQAAKENLTEEQVLQLLDYPSFFDLMELPLPSNRKGIIQRLESEKLIEKKEAKRWAVNNLGAVLFAKKLSDFHHLERKAVRVILYRGNSRVETIKEIVGIKGYASGFEGLIEFINGLLPENEVIGQALRKSVPMFPELAIRELVANAIIHQDFTLTGTGPVIEIFEKRMEITNPGVPLMDTQRFLDTPPRSRNEALASLLRRLGICEERGSGIDKVVTQTEVFQLPAPVFEVTENHTKAILFGHMEFKDMEKEDRIRACYLHCCLKYVNREPMNNASLRERFGISEGNSAMVSRVIKLTVEAELIRLHDPEANRKSWRYVPCWS